MNKLYRLSIFICFVFLISCKTTEKARRKNLEGKNTEYLLEQMNKNAFEFNTLSYKANIKFEGEEGKNSFKADFRLKKDSAIWISIRKLNLEVARVLITNDTVKVINRFSKEYFIGDYSYINTRFNIEFEFELLQALLLGNPIALEGEDKLNFATDKNFYYLGNLKKRKARKAEGKPQKIERKDEEVFSIWLEANSFRISKVLMSDLSANRFIQGTYTEHLLIENQKVPQKLSFNVQSEKPSSLEMEYSKIELNKSFNFPFNISSKYEQVFY